jgi:hypothetical protein
LINTLLFFHFTKTIGEVSSVEVKGDPFIHPNGIAMYHKDQSLFVSCDESIMKVTLSGLIR